MTRTLPLLALALLAATACKTLDVPCWVYSGSGGSTMGGCEPKPSRSPSASATPAPSPSPTAEPTPAPSPAATPTPAPSPTPTPAPTPPPSAHGDVAKLLVLNYGKCVLGKPFVFFLETDCRELDVTATPKSADICGGKACDSTDPSRNLTWHVTKDGRTWIVDDDLVTDIGCATIEAGPVEYTFNRTIVGYSPCLFDLSATYVSSAGHSFTTVAHVQVTR